MQRFQALAVCCSIAIVLGCGGIGGRVHEERLVGDIGLFATDTKEQLELIDFERGNSLVPATVFAVGWDDSHLIAKRHPPSPTGQPNFKLQTEYFIVVVRNRKACGPFDETEYWMHRDVLGVAKEVGFTLTFRELE